MTAFRAMSWTADFFDRSYTEAWEAVGAFEQTDEQVAGLVSMLDLDEPVDILDAPCGFGRIAGPLARLGHRVTGVDASPDQLAIAAERNPGPTYVRGDMAEPPEGPFDVVLNLYTSFGYSADDAADLAMLRAWHAVLRRGGRLVIETMHRDRFAKLHTPGPRQQGPVTETASPDWTTGVVTSSWTFPDGSSRTMRLRLYNATEMLALVRAAGFVDVVATGDYAGAPVTPETRLVVRGTR